MRRSFCQAHFRVFSHSLLALLVLTLTNACVKLPRRAAQTTDATTTATTTLIPINRATHAELERLPGIGPALAARIVEHRERHGPFRRPEHLLIVRGISERRFRELRRFITTD